MSLLLLGGTADARRIAEILHSRGVPVLYAIAGLVRKPELSCTVVSGGFSQFGGLESFVKHRRISTILDATHPYAEKMSATAISVAKQCGINCWRYYRPQWQPGKNDNWQSFPSWDDLLKQLSSKKKIFFSAGQITQAVVDSLGRDQSAVLRTAAQPQLLLPNTFTWIKAIGPFKVDDELALMRQYEIDVVVSKNSGGNATSAKLVAARELNIPVFMLKRPTLPISEREFRDPSLAIAACCELFSCGDAQLD